MNQSPQGLRTKTALGIQVTGTNGLVYSDAYRQDKWIRNTFVCRSFHLKKEHVIGLSLARGRWELLK